MVHEVLVVKYDQFMAPIIPNNGCETRHDLLVSGFESVLTEECFEMRRLGFRIPPGVGRGIEQVEVVPIGNAAE